MFPRNPGEKNNSCTGGAADPFSANEGVGDASLGVVKSNVHI